ncbi:MAG: ATP-binding protein [Vicinamibacterales bacterium]
MAAAGDGLERTTDLLDARFEETRDEQLTKQLLALGRRAMQGPQLITLNQILADLHPMLTRLASDSTRLVVDTAPDLDHVRVDPQHIELLLMNLVANARDAMPHGGTIRIATANVLVDDAFVERHPTARPGHYVSLAVEDTGVGMSDDVLAHIFEPHFTTKPAGHGTGLGLPIVDEIVTRGGGYITIDSRPGVGTTVTACFPAVDAPAVEPAPLRLLTVSGAETILLVEPDDAARDLMRRSLASQGYTVLDAADVWEALTIARSRHDRIDLLITDVVLADMGGPELATHVMGMRPDLRVLYVAGFAQASALGPLALSQRVSFLPRPFGPGALLASVREALDKPLAQH